VLETFTQLQNVAQILAGFGVITVLLALLKRYTERRSWQNFKTLVGGWTDALLESDQKIGHLDNEWRVECERMLTDSRFSPREINELLDTAVVVAKGIAANKFLT
jgi:hypothetical protein